MNLPEVRPKGFEPLTLGSEGGIGDFLNREHAKDLRRQQQGEVILVVHDELASSGMNSDDSSPSAR